MKSFKCFFYSIFLILAISFLPIFTLRSFAGNLVYVYTSMWGSLSNPSDTVLSYTTQLYCPDDFRYIVYISGGQPVTLYSNNNVNSSINWVTTIQTLQDPYYPENAGKISTRSGLINRTSVQGYPDIYAFSLSDVSDGTYNFGYTMPIAYNMDDVVDYLNTGEAPELPYDSTLNLDSFTVYDYQDQDLFDGNIVPKYSAVWKCTWSDPDISFVKVRVTSVNGVADYVGSGSSYVDSVNPAIFANQNGDTITFIATPYASNGSYGNSLYCRFTYHDNSPLSNLFRKFVKTKNFDNTITIPYNGTDKTYEVDGVTTNNTYKVYYNPTTNYYDNSELYEIIYAPVIIYPYETPAEEIDDTSKEVGNTYVTNNYYETTENINYNFEFNFGDISGSDITDTYDEVGGYFDGFGGLIAKLVDLLQALFPMLSPACAVFILVGFGLVITVAIVAFVLKIAGIIADILPL